MTKVFEYLSKSHEMTSMGLLLGMAATRRGTMDAGVAKLLSIHLPALLPPSSTDLDVGPWVQIASLIGVGLLYQGTADRHMVEVLLKEIGKVLFHRSYTTLLARGLCSEKQTNTVLTVRVCPLISRLEMTAEWTGRRTRSQPASRSGLSLLPVDRPRLDLPTCTSKTDCTGAHTSSPPPSRHCSSLP